MLRIAELSIGTEGHLFLGVSRRLDAPAPAAGVGEQLVLSSAGRWRPLLYTVSLVTSAVVANRRIELQVQDADGTPIGSFPAGFSHTAGVTVRYTWALGVIDTPNLPGSGGAAKLSMADLMLEPGYRLAIAVLGIDVGDQLGAGVVWAEEYDTSPGAYPADIAYPFPEHRHQEG